METDTRQPDTSPRLRLVDLRVNPERPTIHFGGRFAGVMTGPDDRSAAASWIATTIAGPRPADADGSIDVGGTIVSVRTLPSPLLAPDAPILIDLSVLRGGWQASCAGLRDELAARHATTRLEGYRIEAALERARSRLDASDSLPEEPEPQPEPVPQPQPEPEPPAPEAVETEPEPAPVVVDAPPDELDPLRARVRVMLAALDTIKLEPLPEGLLLADAWQAQEALVRVRDAAGTLSSAEIDALEARVDAARHALGPTTKGVPDHVRTRIEERHQALVAAEAEAFAAKRKERNRAIAHYEETVAAELMALADAGIDSYASFVAAVAEADSGLDTSARLLAEAELAAARTALDAAMQVPDVPTRAELEERGSHIRRRAAELLGHEVGEGTPAELRALTIEPPERAELVAEIAETMRGGGAQVTDDVVECARVFIVPVPVRVEAPPVADPSPAVSAPPPPAPSPPPPPPAPVAAPVPPPAAVVRASDVQALEDQRDAQAAALAELEAEMDRVESMYVLDVLGLAAADWGRAIESLLVAYRAGNLLAGRLPLVIDGVLDGVAADVRETVVRLLAGADDVQTIIVTDDPEVMQSVANAGGALVRWRSV